MGGQLAVKSELGNGSTFYFIVPIRRDQASCGVAAEPLSIESRPMTTEARPIIPMPAKPARTESPADKLRVLLVEDLPANQMLVTHVLNRRRHDVEVAQNGLRAVELVGQNSFDLVLMDLQMPDMDGFEATAAIRAIPGAARIPIVALTAHALPPTAIAAWPPGWTTILQSLWTFAS